LLITPPFSRFGAPRRDDADHIDIAVIGNRVGDQQQDHAVGHAKGLPSLFPTLDTILFDQRERVRKCPHGDLEADMMLRQIAGGLRRVPLESNCHT
jgi:hypothetical protein